MSFIWRKFAESFVVSSYAAEIRRQELLEKYKSLKVCEPVSLTLKSLKLLYRKTESLNHSVFFLSCTMQESGKLESFLDKRRKKNATKDHRFMPYRRADASEQ